MGWAKHAASRIVSALVAAQNGRLQEKSVWLKISRGMRCYINAITLPFIDSCLHGAVRHVTFSKLRLVWSMEDLRWCYKIGSLRARFWRPACLVEDTVEDCFRCVLIWRNSPKAIGWKWHGARACLAGIGRYLLKCWNSHRLYRFFGGAINCVDNCKLGEYRSAAGLY